MKRDPRQAAVRGQVAELVCAAAILESGSSWAWMPDGARYDGLICFDEADPNTWWRVQIKRIFPRRDNNMAPTCVLSHRGNKNYDKDDADYLAAVDVEAGLVYLFPWEEVYETKRLTIDHEKHQDYVVTKPEENGD